MTARRNGRAPQTTVAARSVKTAQDSGADKVPVSRIEAADKPKANKQDVVLVTGPTDDGKGMNVLRAKNDTLQVGAVRPLEEGKPILGELVTLKPRPDSPALFDVESQLPSPVKPAAPQAAGGGPARRADRASRTDSSARPTTAGPAQVATDTYRSGWDRIYKRGAKKSLPN